LTPRFRRNLLLALATLCLCGASSGPGRPGDGNCGWLIESGDGLVEQADPSLDPLNPKPLAAPPAGTKAAYCIRGTLMTDKGDERLVQLGLPLIIRSGSREGVLELAPSVLFPYRRVGERYLPDKAANEH
jgi:hypothetical protein